MLLLGIPIYALNQKAKESAGVETRQEQPAEEGSLDERGDAPASPDESPRKD